MTDARTTERVAPDLSVIVAAHQHIRALEGLVSSLWQQTLERDRFEVIIVDDGSEPGIPKAIGEPSSPLEAHDLPLRVRVLRQQQAGPAAARNTGIRQARGRVLVFVNADAVLAPDALERHLAAQHKPRAVLGRFDFLPVHRTPFLALAESIGSLFPYDLATPNVPLPFQFFWTGNLSVPASAVRACGGFDERFRFPVFEDIELGRRLIGHGLELVFDPSIGCGHDHPFTLDSWRRRARLFGHQWVVFAKIHGGRAFPVIGGQDEPNEQLAKDLLKGLLNQEEAHDDRVLELERLIAEADAAIARGQSPESATSALIRDGRELLIGVHTVERMKGILTALDGQSLAERATWRESLRPFALVHSLVQAWDGPDTTKILQIMPRDATLIVTHRGWLAPEALPDDPRLVRVRLDNDAESARQWSHLLDATTCQTFIFLEGRPLPGASELDALVRFSSVSPRIGSVALGERTGREYASAAIAARFPRHVIATRRAVLEGDGPGPGTFVDRLVTRGLETALLLPAGAPAG
jgi:GT2 family glycosyltransferase